MRSTILSGILFLAAAQFTWAIDSDYIQRPAPQDPVYLRKSLYPEVKVRIPAPPKPGNPAQARDEEILLQQQKSRSNKDCARALVEVDISIESLFVRNAGPLTENEAKTLSPLIRQVTRDLGFFVAQLKADYARKRPYNYILGLSPCVPKEQNNAYPSGHALISQVDALILSDIFPERKTLFLDRALLIANDRVLGGVHHPSDIEAGRELADFFYNKLNESAKFKTDFAALRLKAAAQEITIDPKLYDSKSLKPVILDGPGDMDHVVAMNIPYPPIKELRPRIEGKTGEKLDFLRHWQPEGEAHITVITPLEYPALRGPDPTHPVLTGQDFTRLAKIHSLQASKFKVLGLGSGHKVINGKEESTYFLIVEAPNLVAFRQAVKAEYVKKSGKSPAFLPEHYFPHITIGFTLRDLHENDGVIKDLSHSKDARFILKPRPGG